MSVLSKLLMADSSLPYNCYELGHTFTPFCTESSLIISSSVLRESLKMYSLLYFLTHLIFVRKFGYENFKITFQSIFRSTSFLTFNALSTLCLFCMSRHLAGRFYLPLVSHLPAIISSFGSLKIERENRRSALAFYCCNIAMETIIFGNLNTRNNLERFNKKHNIVTKRNSTGLYPIAVQAGFLSMIFDLFKLNVDDFKRFSMYTFGVTSIIYLTKLKCREQAMLQSKNDDAKGPVKKEHTDLVCLAFKHLIGEKEFDDESICAAKVKLGDDAGEPTKKKQIKSWMNRLFAYSHRTSSDCLSNDQMSNCLKSSASCSLRGLAIGFLSNFALLFAMHLKNNKFRLKQSFWSLLTRAENFKFSLLLGSFNGFYKLFNCLLHKLEEKRSGWHSVASSIAGIVVPKLLFGKQITSPNLNLTQYLFWKSIENWFWHFARAHQEKRERMHEKYLKMIDEEMSKRPVRSINDRPGATTTAATETTIETTNEKRIGSVTTTKDDRSANINLHTSDQLKEKINKLTVNDTLQLNELADKLTQIEVRQQFSIFNYISSDNLVGLIYSLSVSQLFYVAVS